MKPQLLQASNAGAEATIPWMKNPRSDLKVGQYKSAEKINLHA